MFVFKNNEKSHPQGVRRRKTHRNPPSSLSPESQRATMSAVECDPRKTACDSYPRHPTPCPQTLQSLHIIISQQIIDVHTESTFRNNQPCTSSARFIYLSKATKSICPIPWSQRKISGDDPTFHLSTSNWSCRIVSVSQPNNSLSCFYNHFGCSLHGWHVCQMVRPMGLSSIVLAHAIAPVSSYHSVCHNGNCPPMAPTALQLRLATVASAVVILVRNAPLLCSLSWP